ncbi:RES family NAD+ phosphorylase [Pigmentiphaga soli]|uniref:RES family NAD+ phosphorylase n=2 Tax=Pigmentiphaga soli TaxID=1007095 RepID=A0ABP8H0X6_9BURK
MTGEGAKRTGGRWNRRGTPALYCAGSAALACLETVVHLGAEGLPLNRYLVRLEIPEAIWDKAIVHDQATLPVGWDALPAGKVSLDVGTAWAKSGSSAVLVVPSVIVPEEFNAIVNPLHPDAGSITAVKIRKWTYDGRLR